MAKALLVGRLVEATEGPRGGRDRSNPGGGSRRNRGRSQQPLEPNMQRATVEIPHPSDPLIGLAATVAFGCVLTCPLLRASVVGSGEIIVRRLGCYWCAKKACHLYSQPSRFSSPCNHTHPSSTNYVLAVAPHPHPQPPPTPIPIREDR